MLSKVYENNEIKKPHIVLAHLGSLNESDKVIEMLCGKNIYLDTAAMLDRIPNEKIIEIIRRHGSDKVLFASDSPWAAQNKYVELLNSLPLTEEEKENILYRNAKNMLNA